MKKIIIICAAIVLGIIGLLYNYHSNESTEITITNVIKDANNEYLVYTEEGEVFKNVDAFLHWKWNSSNVTNTLFTDRAKKRKSKVKAYGWRWPFFSMYRNISSVTEQDNK